jgi:hypothetical protein
MRVTTTTATALAMLALAGRPCAQEPPKVDPAAERARYMAEVKKAIEGKEKAPAKDVFKNLKMFPADRPAENVLGAMEAFSRALGVDCSHCHVPGKWDADEKAAKGIARGMMAFSRGLGDQIKLIEGLGNQNPRVTCTTCHRGAVKPATSL